MTDVPVETRWNKPRGMQKNELTQRFGVSSSSPFSSTAAEGDSPGARRTAAEQQ